MMQLSTTSIQVFLCNAMEQKSIENQFYDTNTFDNKTHCEKKKKK